MLSPPATPTTRSTWQRCTRAGTPGRPSWPWHKKWTRKEKRGPPRQRHQKNSGALRPTRGRQPWRECRRGGGRESNERMDSALKSAAERAFRRDRPCVRALIPWTCPIIQSRERRATVRLGESTAGQPPDFALVSPAQSRWLRQRTAARTPPHPRARPRGAADAAATDPLFARPPPSSSRPPLSWLSSPPPRR